MLTRNSFLGTVGSLLMVTGFLLGSVTSLRSQVESRQSNGLNSRHEALKVKRDFYYSQLAKMEPKDLQGPDAAHKISGLYKVADLAELPEETAKWRREMYLEHPTHWFSSYLRRNDGWDGIVRFILEEFCSLDNRFEDADMTKLKTLLAQMGREYAIPPDLDPILLFAIFLPENSRDGILDFMRANQKIIFQSEKGKVLRILVTENKNWENQLTDLDGLKRQPLVDKYKQLLYEKKISPTSRENPLIAVAAARSYIRLEDPKRAEKALLLAKKGEAYPDYILAKAQVFVEQHQYEQAIGVLKNLVTTVTKSSSMNQTSEDLETLNHHLSNRGKLNPKYHAMLKALTDRQPESVLIRITNLTNLDKEYQAYVRVHLPTDSMEIVWIKNKKVLFAYRADPKGCASYFQDNKAIKSTPNQGQVFKFSYNYDTLFLTSGFFFIPVQHGEGAIREFFTELLATLKNQMDKKQDMETVCMNFNHLIDRADDSGTVVLKKIHGLEKTTSSLTITLDRNFLPLRFATSTMAIEFLAWENRLCEQMIAAVWPQAPLEEVSDPDPTDIIKIVDTIRATWFEIQTEQEKATKPAGEK